MIQANEIRIGNRFFLKDNTITQIIVDSFQSAFLLGKRGLEALNPIPLTEEILLNFGFIAELPIGWYGLNEFKLYYTSVKNDYYEYYFEDGNIIIKYVHQLQNLYFALTQQELIYNNLTTQKK